MHDDVFARVNIKQLVIFPADDSSWVGTLYNMLIPCGGAHSEYE